MNPELLIKLLSTEDLDALLKIGKNLVDAYGVIKKSEMAEGLADVAEDVATLLDRIATRNRARNIAAFKEYTEAGMTAEQAVDLICASKYAFHRDIKKIGQAVKSGKLNVCIN